MIRHVVLAAAAAAMAGGCDLLSAGDSIPTFKTTVSAEEALTAELQKAHLEQTRSLLLISRGTYSCGDPRSRREKSPVGAREKSDADRKGEAKAALELLSAYQQTLDAIVARTKKKLDADANVFGNAQKAVEAIGIIPAAAPFTPAASSAIALMASAIASANTQIANWQMVEYARGMKGVLAVAVDTLKRNYDSFTEVGEAAFSVWDACARETLYYVRDVAGQGIYLDNGRRLESYIAPSSGVELAGAWNAYRNKRAEYRGRLPTQQAYNAQLDAIVTQNETLAAGKVNVEQAATSIGNLATKAQKACEEFQKATKNPALDICKKSTS
jgi:hypothetical protein